MIAPKAARDAVVLAGVTVLFIATLAMFGKVVGFASPWFGTIAMFDALGIVAFARRVFLLGLPEFLRRVRAFESEGEIYKALRVPAFGALLRRSPMRHLNPTVYLRRHPDDPSAVLAQIESAEAAHFLAAALLVPYIVVAGARGQWRAVAWLTAVQIAFNLYPILHLRWVRIRLKRMRARTPRRAPGIVGTLSS